MAASRDVYWMALGKARPSVQHQSEGAARAEAERLAKADPGQKFVVLKAEAEYVRQPEPVDRTELVMPKRDLSAYEYIDWAMVRPPRYRGFPW